MPIHMQMFKDIYMETPDIKSNGQIRTIHYVSKTTKRNVKKTNRICVPFAFKIHPGSMVIPLEIYWPTLSENIPQNTGAQHLLTLETRSFALITMNNLAGNESLINHNNHPHIFEMLSYASYIEQWRQFVQSTNFILLSTLKDVLLVCTYFLLGRGAWYND